MDFKSREQAGAKSENVVSLFGHNMNELVLNDPFTTLIQESEIEDFDLEDDEEIIEAKIPRKMVSENQFPDQSMFTLEEQLANLKSNLGRIKFYLGDLEDLIPR